MTYSQCLNCQSSPSKVTAQNSWLSRISLYKPDMCISCANSLRGEVQLKIKLILLPQTEMVTRQEVVHQYCETESCPAALYPSTADSIGAGELNFSVLLVLPLICPHLKWNILHREGAACIGLMKCSSHPRPGFEGWSPVFMRDTRVLTWVLGFLPHLPHPFDAYELPLTASHLRLLNEIKSREYILEGKRDEWWTWPCIGLCAVPALQWCLVEYITTCSHYSHN